MQTGEQELKASSMYSFQAQKVAREVGGRRESVGQNVFFAISGHLPAKESCVNPTQAGPCSFGDRDSKDLNWLLVLGKLFY